MRLLARFITLLLLVTAAACATQPPRFRDEAAAKLIWLALRNVTEEWKRPSIYWKRAINQFAILYAERFTKLAA